MSDADIRSFIINRLWAAMKRETLMILAEGRIADGFDSACEIAVEKLDQVSDEIQFSREDTTNLMQVAKTSLGSKMYGHILLNYSRMLTGNVSRLRCLEPKLGPVL